MNKSLSLPSTSCFLNNKTNILGNKSPFYVINIMKAATRHHTNLAQSREKRGLGWKGGGVKDRFLKKLTVKNYFKVESSSLGR